MKKLAYYGVVGIAQTLFKEYLTERFQYVQFNDSCSSKKNIKTGVPQGSILGPLLFLIYINDLPEISRHIKMVMYADDTTLYCNLGDLSEDIINTELTKVSEWLAANKLSLNVKKTKCMVFHTPQRKVTYPEIKINNILIERVSEFNFLGITFNSNLKWHTHINYITKKITGIVGLLWRLKDLYPMTVLRMLYNSLILPHLSYGILTWGAKISRDDKLHLIQKRCLRLISNSSYIAHTEPICKDLRIISLPDMYSVAMWKFYYKLMNNILPSYFILMKPELPPTVDQYEIRRPKFRVPFIKHVFAEHLLEYQMIIQLNEPGSIHYSSKVFTHSFLGFKLYLKNNCDKLIFELL